MTEIQEVVDELRFILQREVIEQSDELTQLVKKYSSLCHDMNVRLRRCDQCLKQGLRSEALHLAQAEPDLLDAIAVLDFPERQDLIDLINMYFMPVPEPLLLEVATDLNVAYADQAPLEHVLDSHRLLALGRAPLHQRLSVLRTLATLDSGTPHWDEDIREMERTRFRELDGESAAAEKAGDVAKLKLLVGEIQSGDWRETVPAALSREIKSRGVRSARVNARVRMKELSELLYSAFSALDANAARPLRDEWENAQRIVQLEASDPLAEQVAPILEWLTDEDSKEADSTAFTRIVAEIERAIGEESTTSADLKRLKLTADRLERALPPTLETRFRTRLSTAEILEGRRRRLMIGASAGAVALVLGFLGFMMYLSMEGEKTRRLVAAIGDFVDEGRLTEAQALIDQHAANSTTEAWLAVKKKLSDAQQAEQDRVLKWKAEIAAAQSATELSAIEAAIKRARELSKTADEKIEVGQLQGSWEKRANAELAAREKDVRERIAVTTEALQALDKAIGSGESNDPDQLAPLLEKADSQVAQLMPRSDGVSRELSSQCALLQSRLVASRKSVADLARKSGLLAKITAAALILPEGGSGSSRPGAYEAALREYAELLPNDSKSITMKSAADISPLPAVTGCQEMISRWKRFRPLDKKDVETRLREIRSHFSEHPQSPDRERLGAYETWLASVLRRFEDDGDPDEGVKQRMYALFNSKFIKEGHIVIDNQRRTYYLPKPQTDSNDNGKFPYLVGFNGETRRDVSFDQLLTRVSGPPPQQEISAKVRSTIRGVSLDGWRDYFLELTETLLKGDKLDPVLKYLLILKTLEYASQGDHLLEQDLAEVFEKLRDDDLDRSVPWMDPNNESAKKARERAAEVLARLPALEPIFANTTIRQNQFEKDLFTRRFSMGWLEKSAQGEWICRTKWSPSGEHELLVVSRPDASGARSWVSLGRIQGKSIRVQSDVAQSVGEAAVVFALNSTLDTKTAQSQ
jgi:hypothetical protein